MSDRAPLLKKVHLFLYCLNNVLGQIITSEVICYASVCVLKVGDKGKSGPAAEHNWSDTASEEQPDSPTRSRQADHEYHEISDEEQPTAKVRVQDDRLALKYSPNICGSVVIQV